MFVSKYFLLALFVAYLGQSRGQPTCFRDNTELRNAVLAFEGNPNSTESDYGSPIGTWCVKDVTDFTEIFSNINLDEDLSGWDVSNATSFRSMFSESSMTGIGLGSWNTSQVQDFGRMFFRNSPIGSDIGLWDTSSAVSILAPTCCWKCRVWLADESETLFDIIAVGLATTYPLSSSSSSSSSQTNMEFMFSGGSRFNTDVSMWSVSNVVTMQSMFFGASAFEGIGLDSWITTSLTNMGSKCCAMTPTVVLSHEFTQLPISSFFRRYVRKRDVTPSRRSVGMVSTAQVFNSSELGLHSTFLSIFLSPTATKTGIHPK
jgi:hypothetical protein